ncbi:histone-lysine N-methyltransferase 2D-like [Frankliniella occidentalis]|uniref:Histone-lysine N-methyltransferase 2D-like n=1 Tax=Frankliniella occidentalis TaxID=133901 RepID=A0A9C6U0R6_FRAOC|nr:histone-lysine N-methyltransferase 2D-like [Frankliniella occidentalis]XP_052124031.1 histone-lysine N-methyltransferase 2D-like [Frankliniella occidentalis]
MMDVASGMDYVYEDVFKEITRKLYVDAVTMQQQPNGQGANGQSVIAGVFNGVINEAIVVNGKMADFAEAFKQQQQQQLSPEQQQPSPPQVEAAGVIVEAATATTVYLQDQFQTETDAATAALVVGEGGALTEAEAAAMAVDTFDGQQVAGAQHLEEDEASAGPGQAQAGEGEVDPNAPDTWFMTDESLEWTDSKIASYNPKQKLFRCIDCECCGFLARVAEHWLGTHANLRVFQCPHCPYASAWARCVRMHLARQHNASEQNALWTENPVLGEVTKYLSRLRARVEAGPIVMVNEDELVEDEQQQLELEQHEQQLQEQQLREQQLLEQQLHEQQLREQQMHEQQLQQQLQQQAAAQAAALGVATGSPTQTEQYTLVTTAGVESVVISASALQQAQALVGLPSSTVAAAQPAAQPARPRNRGKGGGPRRVNKSIAVAAAVAAAAARGDNPDQAASAGTATGEVTLHSVVTRVV